MVDSPETAAESGLETTSHCVLITGASGAIGAALAEAYAAPGVGLVLQGRRRDALEAVAGRCRSRGALVELALLDLCASDARSAWLSDLCQRRVPDVFIANAGINISAGHRQQGEEPADMARLLDLNVCATLMMSNYLAEQMRQRGSGQIGLVSSLAGFFGLPLTPSYSASKAAIKAYGEGLRAGMGRYGVGVTVIMPGYVASPMCEGMAGPKPFLWQPPRAAAAIRRALERNRARLSFPFPLNLGCWLLAVMPAALSQRCLKWLGYGG